MLNVGRTVAGGLYRVFAGEGGRIAENSGHDIVDQYLLKVKRSIVSRVTFGFGQAEALVKRNKQAIAYGKGFWA